MSIYATLGDIMIPTGRWSEWSQCEDDIHVDRQEEYVLITFQGVPPHIGHPATYRDGDPYGSFLPPPVQLDVQRELDLDHQEMRAVVVIGPKSWKEGQEYKNALLTLTGEEWNRLPWPELWSRIEAAMERHLTAPGRGAGER